MPEVAGRKQLVAGAVLVWSMVAAACGSGGTGSAEDPAKLNVVTTVSPLTSIVSSIAGDLAEVRGLVPEGANSHTFEPPPSAARTLSSSPRSSQGRTHAASAAIARF